MPRKLTNEEHIQQFVNTHGTRYDYSKTEYKGSNIKILIGCSIHGDFLQFPSDHRRGFGCPQCSNKARLTTSQFIEKAKAVHGDTYDYSKVDYVSMNTPVIIVCKKHGEFQTRPTWHVYGTQIGCSLCSLSKGEFQIKQYLDQHSIYYKQQFIFDDCINPKTNHRLKFDFYLPDYNLCIEFDGAQHFSSVHYRGRVLNPEKQEDLYQKIVESDLIKTNYCKNNNIELLRISYKFLTQITSILHEKFCIASN